MHLLQKLWRHGQVKYPILGEVKQRVAEFFLCPFGGTVMILQATAQKSGTNITHFCLCLQGFPRSEVHLAYNIHFVATSNIASPLEMAEGITEDMRSVSFADDVIVY